MSERPQHYLGEALTHAVLQRRREAAQTRQRRALVEVEAHVSTQVAIAAELDEGMQHLSTHREELHRIDSEAKDGSLLAALVRPFTTRRTALARRSVTEALVERYEAVSVRLREATAFSDELKLTALELQQEVDRLHRELGEALHNQRVAAQRVLRGQEALDALDDQPELSEEAKARRRDRFGFDVRTETVALDLFEASAEHCRAHLPAARQLRDTVLKLHEEMAAYVLGATHTVNAAGRRIQGLGMLADAPTVVTELQESLDALQEAMEATQAYVESSQEMVARVLPELSARVAAAGEAGAAVLEADLRSLDREKRRAKAERALRHAAEDEIAELLGDV